MTMPRGPMLATALIEGAPLWSGQVQDTIGHPAPLGERPAPSVVTRVRRGTALEVHAAPAYGGLWWLVQVGPHAGRMVRQHDPSWSINP